MSRSQFLLDSEGRKHSEQLLSGMDALWLCLIHTEICICYHAGMAPHSEQSSSVASIIHTFPLQVKPEPSEVHGCSYRRVSPDHTLQENWCPACNAAYGKTCWTWAFHHASCKYTCPSCILYIAPCGYACRRCLRPPSSCRYTLLEPCHQSLCKIKFMEESPPSL